MTFGPPCPPCKYPAACACENMQRMAEELAFPVRDVIECAGDDCALRDGHSVPHMSDLALARLDGAGQATQKLLPL